MDFTVLDTLEFFKIRKLLAEQTSTIIGRELAENLMPSNDSKVVQHRLNETNEARQIMLAKLNIPLGGIQDIRETLKRSKIGAVLEPHELIAVSNNLYAARRLKKFFADVQQVPILYSIIEQLTILQNIENAVENVVNEQGAIRDDASIELYNIRRDIRLYQRRVKDKIDSILHSAEYQKYFQDVLVTIRNDRYVIPIKQEYRHHFPGIVHDQSSSGATLFIEPMAVVNLNNDVKQLMASEKNEVERILRKISQQISSVADIILENCLLMGQIDFVFAKARLSANMMAQMPIINDNGQLELLNARHPLIDKEYVVPISITLGQGFNTLLITGPNTGGKTVSLKTVGLFVLMNQSGLFIPASSGSQLPIYKNVFADIGDEQSIEQSLSTFSAHMTNLVKILNKVSSNDLVLIDEIGAGTDPHEGAALAMSVLEYLHNIGVSTIVTTHYSELKTFAYTRKGIENASVEFDIQSLRPTYRLLIGVPGSSNAFAISERLGLNSDIIQNARTMIDKDYAKFETVLASLEEQKIIYSKKNEEINTLRQELKKAEQLFAKEKENFEKKRQEMLVRAKDEAASLLRQARRTSEEVITTLKAQFNVEDVKTRQQSITKVRNRLKENLNEITTSQDECELLPEVADGEVEPGVIVYVTSLKQKGTVISVQDNNVIVQFGIMKMTVPINQCRIVEEQVNHEETKNSKYQAMIKVQTVPRQIDIRGMNVEESEEVLDKYFDDAILAGLSEVLVIHGKGTGALRKGIREYLKAHRLVKEIRVAELNEGGNGATSVKF